MQTWKAWKESPAPDASEPAVDRFVRHDEGGFEATGAAGVSVRRLHLDPVRRTATMLVRMEPGSSYPSHRHGGLEECYVLSGDLRHDDRVMRGGDYEVVSEGSKHGRQWTEDGCLLAEHWYRVGSWFVRRFLGPRVTGRADRPGYNVTSIEHTLAKVQAHFEARATTR